MLIFTESDCAELVERLNHKLHQVIPYTAYNKAHCQEARAYAEGIEDCCTVLKSEPILYYDWIQKDFTKLLDREHMGNGKGRRAYEQGVLACKSIVSAYKRTIQEVNNAEQ